MHFFIIQEFFFFELPVLTFVYFSTFSLLIVGVFILSTHRITDPLSIIQQGHKCMQPSATHGIIEICKIVDGHDGNLNIK